MKRRLSGFTLVELMIAVAVVALLSSLVAVNYSRNKAQARDANRKENVQSYGAALELYYATSHTYAVKNGSCDLSGDISYAGGSLLTNPDCVGYQGKGWGAMTRKGISNTYGATSIADALVNRGLLSEVRLDPRSTSVSTHSTDPATYDDYLLTVCQLDGTLATTADNALTYSIQANLELPNSQEQTNATHLCGASGTGKAALPALP